MNNADVMDGEDRPWKIGEFWSSSTPGKKVWMLANPEDIQRYGTHRDFIRWIAESDQMQSQATRIAELEAAVTSMELGRRDAELPEVLFYKEDRACRSAIRVEYIKSDSLCYYYAKCEGSSSVVVNISKFEIGNILVGKSGKFFLTRKELQEDTLGYLKGCVAALQNYLSEESDAAIALSKEQK